MASYMERHISTLGFPVVEDTVTSGHMFGGVMGGKTFGLDKTRSCSAKAYLGDTIRSQSFSHHAFLRNTRRGRIRCD